MGKLTPKDTVLGSFSYAVTTGVVTLKFTGNAPSTVSFATFVDSLRANTTDIITPKVDGYLYDPKTGRVTFGITLTLKPKVVQYAHGS